MSVETVMSDATVLMKQGKMEQALDLLQEAHTTYATDGNIAFLHAATLAQVEQYEQALTAYERAVALNPQLLIARFQYGLLLATLGSNEKAITILTPLATESEHYLNTFALGIICILQGDAEQAERAIDKGLQANNENASLNQDMENMLSRLQASVQQEVAEPESEMPQEDESDRSHLLDVYQSRN